MPACQVNHVDVVTDSRPVGGGVIVPENFDKRQLSRRDFGHIRHEIVGDAFRVLADQARRMRADWVEVPEQNDAPFMVGCVEVDEDLLDHRLRPAVGVGGGPFRAFFIDWDVCGLAVHGSAAREDEVLAAVRSGGIAKAQGADDVVVVVLEGLGDAFAYGFESCEVDDGGGVVFFEDAV